MRRRFSAFPDGGPGLGLLLLRTAAGLALIFQGAAWATSQPRGPWPASVLTGALLLLGLLSRTASLLTAVAGLAVAFSGLPAGLFKACAPAALLLAAMGLALRFLGPGAYSLDARWRGRREVVIPPRDGGPPDH